MKLPTLSLNQRFRLPQAQPALAGAVAGSGPGGHSRPNSKRGGTTLFASGSDDDGYGGYDDDVPYEDPPQNTRRTPGAQRAGAGGSGNGGGSGGGRQRSVQFQPEERYWTEYLRIALPIIGLLLMIGLFWFWASQLTNDDNGGDEPIATEALGATEIITPPASTPEPTQQVVVPPTSAPAEDPVSTPEEEEAAPPEEETGDTDPPEEEPVDDAGGFAIEDSVIVSEDGLNMRDEATTAGNIVTTLDANTVLTIQEGPVEADGYAWYQVIVEETAEVGWVADEFIEPAG